VVFLNDRARILHELVPGSVYPWSTVSAVHRTQNGIYQRRGCLISLLTDFGRINPCYPDHAGVDGVSIMYTGSGRHGDQKLDPANRALVAAAGTGEAFPLFNKLSVNRWEFLGLWTVNEPRYIFDERQNRMLWKFTLQRAEN
jgi:hypothetical protein